MRVLVVEDDKDLAGLISKELEEQLWSVETAYEGETGKHLALSSNYDLILLDLMLPVLDGLSICAQIRSRGIKTPVIMLTARDSIDDRVLGLDSGADDYLVKPFALSELFARIRALMRRLENRSQGLLRAGELKLDPTTDFVFRQDRKITLTAREFSLLQLFMQNPNKILSRTLILEKVWDANYSGLSNVVDVYINTLRNKLESGGEDRIIATIRGRGYRLESA